MFRTVLVSKGEKLSIRDNWLIVSKDERETKIPIEDIFSVVVDQPNAVITVPTITRLTSEGVHLIICDEKHVPSSIILSNSNHYRPLSVIRKQMLMAEEMKDKLWDRVVSAKIKNQASVLSLCGGERNRINRLLELAEGIYEGDINNCEGVAAKMFFRDMYGSSFIRQADDGINAALNYGYTIIRSTFCKTLIAYGYNCVLGIHHINEFNPFNLADDMMEPLRPAVDLWVNDNAEDLDGNLSSQQRIELAGLVNTDVVWDGKNMKMRNAIDRYISSFTTAIDKKDPSLLKIPEVIRPDFYSYEE